ncbi:hypothetical protein [Polaribacter septentrionalilitoris]|uniref:hypothetical protein n=1 Tax=Polaribacter septentrionalilitoris TaxID=2494657 RepID=UPI00135754FC|nr:hypothetical protein [Polaribacter septentrionalilitoris]
MNKLIFHQDINNNLIVINISNYQELSLRYSFEELNKRILNFILENKIENVKLSFNNILCDIFIINKIFKIKALLLYFDITIYSIEISFKLN